MAADVEQLVAMMRKHKIMSLHTPDGVKIDLHPSVFDPDAPAEAPDTEKGPDLDEIGSTGTSRAQQLAILGQVFEDDFVKSSKKAR